MPESDPLLSGPGLPEFRDLFAKRPPAYPHRCQVLLSIVIRRTRYRIITNRTHSRFWYEATWADAGGFGSLRAYASTTSKKKADAWMVAVADASGIPHGYGRTAQGPAK